MADDTLMPEHNKLYKKQFDLLSDYTTEYEDMREFLRKEIFPKLPSQGHFLDIGAGRGNYAQPFSQEFTQTTIIEPNKMFFDDILVWAKANGTRIAGYNSAWQMVDLESQADFILISHMLYYVPKDKRLGFIQKAYDVLNPGGYMLIVLNSEDSGIRKIYKEFYPEDLYAEMPSGEEIAELMRTNGFTDAVEQIFPAEITVPSMEDLYSLIDFLLLRKIPFTSDEMLARRQTFIENNLICNGDFVVDSEGTIVIMKKPTQL